ncbi:hypothetical protein ABOM_000421 [Aspergillus bombycis]|uniref:NAD(P)-binding domain-containing protein n=1 Tax=Aspergillus bombycis TaxID=109264 RepID=A0A1F8AHY6_9EURO|nr:hypothetical protein ABOM_000421 [Aspergillus bombycis]OGM51311.1 hypothetical protein ABOM_000421 [Aspergillus bombycis]
MVSALLIGGTGLGSHLLKNLVLHPTIVSINTFSRRNPSNANILSEKLEPFVSPDTSQWAEGIRHLSSPPDLFFSAFGTTRAAAGSFEAQYKLEHDLHLELAKAAKAAGSRVCVLISSPFANENSSMAYARMKGQIEEGIKALKFQKTIILQPGIILGARGESRVGEAIAQEVVKVIGLIFPSIRDMMGQDAQVIARAAVTAGLRALEETNSANTAAIEIIKRGELLQHASP